MTEFFKDIAKLMTDGVNVQINIHKKGDELTVSIITTGNTTDPAASQITPLNLVGTAQEIDEGFFAQVSAPIQKTIGILKNMEEYEKGQKEADAQKKELKDAEDKKKREAKERKEKYDKLLKKSDELEKKKEFKKAIGALNEAKNFTDKPDAVNKRIKELAEKITGGGLFAGEAVEDIKTNFADEIKTETPDSDQDDDDDDDNEEKGETE